MSSAVLAVAASETAPLAYIPSSTDAATNTLNTVRVAHRRGSFLLCLFPFLLALALHFHLTLQERLGGPAAGLGLCLALRATTVLCVTLRGSVELAGVSLLSGL
jgi:hypothetical protein